MTRRGRPARRRPPGRAALLLGTAAVLAGASLAGCAAFRSPSTLSGMEKQIARGERISASTRADAPPASASASGPATPAPRASLQPVTGRMVTAVGDSVMAASAMALQAVLPGIYIDAKPDREMPAGLAILRRLAATGRLRPVVVVGLGTNYLVSTGQLNQLMQILGPQRRLVLINTYVPDSWSPQVNATEAAFIRGHPGVVPADWFDTIKNRMNLLWPDHVHPIIPGTLVYARLVYQAIQATRAAPAPAGPARAGPARAGPALAGPGVLPLPHPQLTAAG